jgi:hypothetical protein
MWKATASLHHDLHESKENKRYLQKRGRIEETLKSQSKPALGGAMFGAVRLNTSYLRCLNLPGMCLEGFQVET